MAEDQNNKVISKKHSGFPDWLNFDKLRSESLDYLGKLSGKIWTDHNVHDPGITILEMLCYALIDLGYRTNLPPEDLFARNPEDTSAENNFFSPSQILTCNPLTITDYRKLLIDIPGVNNAWLEVAQPHKVANEYIPDNDIDPCNIFKSPAGDNVQCLQFLNGLYHVYIDFENEPDDHEREIILGKVKSALMAHRNLCEDFVDVTFLCKQKVGICAEIELEINADAEQVYKEVVENLRNFFSPSPKFYTLQQLLDKNKSIEEIFAGRPYDIKESHGFVDVEEFEKIRLMKEIHVSDVYHEIFNVEGVRTVRNLSLRNCDNSICDDVDAAQNPYWKFKLFENHIPDFSLDCSAFQFTRHGNKVSVDTKKFAQYFKLKFSFSGKVLYQNPSPYLDAEIPMGIYHGDLGEYYSIQNEFPRVYGIGEGGLPANASNLRMAQALQLKGYLLFFDQFLANYVMQLKSIRDVLSLSAAPGKEQKNTYFINQLTNVPDLNKLLRFKNSGDETNTLGEEGAILAMPVKKRDLEDLLKSKELIKKDIENDFQSCSFITASERDIAMTLLREDLLNGEFSSVQIANNCDKWFFYLFTSSEDIALISKRYYENEIEARTAAASVMYIGIYKENYRSYSGSATGPFSFDLKMNMAGYLKYLQFIVEDENLYVKRRQQFLDHLLARFAERFTDYTLLSFGFLDEHRLGEAAIAAKERFLFSYPDLSSNRGKAYDYKMSEWGTNNISGFEKRFKALTGADSWGRKSLCNFEVVKYDELFFINLSIDEYELLRSVNKFNSLSEAGRALRSLLDAVANRDNYSSRHFSFDKAYYAQIKDDNEFPQDEVYHVQVKAGDEIFVHPQNFSNFNEAAEAKEELFTLFSQVPSGDNIEVSSYEHFLQLNDVDGNSVLRRNEPITTQEEKIIITDDLLRDVNVSSRWEPVSGPLASRHLKNDPAHPEYFINLYAFIINIFPSDLKKDVVRYKYSIYDSDRTFLFHSENEFDNEDEAINDCHKVLFLLRDLANYHVVKDNDAEQYRIQIKDRNAVYAIDSVEYSTAGEAHNAGHEIHRSVNLHTYKLEDVTAANEWKTYKFRLGFPGREKFIFNSQQKNFENGDDGWKEIAGLTAVNSKSGYSIDRTNNVLEIKAPSHGVIARCPLPEKYLAAGASDPLSVANSFFDLKKKINDLLQGARGESELEKYVIQEGSRLGGDFGYRLVNKDLFYAYLLDKKIDKLKDKDAIKIFFDKASAGYDVLEISIGIHELKHKKTKDTWYRYQLIYRDRRKNAAEGPLFESVRGYLSREDAEKAYYENLWIILTKALEKDSYGSYISIGDTVLPEEDYCDPESAVVFIPKSTFEKLGSNIENVINKVKSYPVRSIKKSSAGYLHYFGCEKTPPEVKEPVKQDCKGTEIEKDLYYFVLLDKVTHNDEWISYTCYDSAAEAMQQFEFFLILLGYEGNYHVDYNDCDCTPRLYIREILAESLARFGSVKDAWDGVEKFICVSQSGDAIHTYIRPGDYCYSFHVACGATGLIHPCHYDSAEIRDKTLDKLYELSKNEGHWTSFMKIFNQVFSKDFTSQLPAREKLLCDVKLFEIVDAVLYGGEIGEDDAGNFFIRIRNNSQIENLNTTSNGLTFREWRKKLYSFAYYFPVIKREGQYFVELKFPEFCRKDLTDDKPCDSGNDASEVEDCCCIAWKSGCCFETCESASAYYFEIFKCLSEHTNYKAVFGCECGPYGIELHCACTVTAEKKLSVNAESAEGNINIPSGDSGSDTGILKESACCNEIIAVNPQCYTTPKMDCEAVERAKKSINGEGLHLVEHILLRPHCESDCTCVITPCTEDPLVKELNDCTFEWQIKDNDVCAADVDKTICFIPGSDPYSFIATVVLPAWPSRFRKRENRALIENILYREAPAHVLLRILWLSPRDLCDFETHFKQWTRWIANKQVCEADFSVCKFLRLLFITKFDQIKDCDVCRPCSDRTGVTDPCFPVENAPPENYFPDSLNRLYCWNTSDIEKWISPVQISPEKSEVIPSPETISSGDDEIASGVVTTPGKPEDIPSTASPEEIGAVPAPATRGREKQAKATPDKATISVERKKFLRIQSRYNVYKQNISDILSANPDNLVTANALIFLQKSTANSKDYADLITDIINIPDKTKDNTGINKTDKKTLIRNITWRYLDTIFFNEKEMQKIISVEDVFKQLKQNKINMNVLFQDWKSDEIREFEPDIDFGEIKSYLTEQ